MFLKVLPTMNVGDRNAYLCVSFSERSAYVLRGEDLLDIYPRKVYYFPKTGRVLVKKLKNMHNDTLVKREEAYASKL